MAKKADIELKVTSQDLILGKLQETDLGVYLASIVAIQAPVQMAEAFRGK